MKKQLAILGLTAGLAGGGIAGLAFTGSPVIAGAQDAPTSTALDSPANSNTTGAAGRSADRPDLSTHLQSALKGLVADGTITQAQADAVVTAIEAAGPPEGGRGGHRGPHLDAAATALGMTVDELRTELQGGKTIAGVASQRDVDIDAVISAMTAEFQAHLDAEVADGTHTQAEADQKAADATARITAMVNGDGPMGRGPGGGPR